MTNDKLEAIRRRDQSPYRASTAWLSQSEEDRRALLAAYDALAARLAEVQDKLSIALAANHDLRDERDSLKDRLADPCKTYDKDGRLLTVCHRLAEAEKESVQDRRDLMDELTSVVERLGEAEALLRDIRPLLDGVRNESKGKTDLGYRVLTHLVDRIDAFLASDSSRGDDE